MPQARSPEDSVARIPAARAAGGRPRVAVVGSGIAGLTVAHRLQDVCELQVFEAGAHIGGHVHTHRVEVDGSEIAVDTGFIVFNDWTYPGFIALLEELGVQSRASDMSFSVRSERSGLEYNGTSLNSLFAQRSNALRPSFWRMVRGILRFHKEAPALLETDAGQRAALEQSLGDFLERGAYPREFIEHYIVPMGSAIWSATPARLLEFPLLSFVRFLKNHGMLSVNERPVWRTIRGGSARYVEKLVASFAGRVHLNSSVRSVRRLERGVELQFDGDWRERFDAVFLALHSDRALALLADPSDAERDILAAIEYQRNDVVLHTDARMLPRRPLARAAWNYHLDAEAARSVGGPLEGARRATVTYWMNHLQGLTVQTPVCVTLNRNAAIDPARVLRELVYEHPVFTREAVRAQGRRGDISGVRSTYYCGAYWRNGFHEDGLQSGLDAVREFQVNLNAAGREDN